MIAVAHARRLIEQDHELAIAADAATIAAAPPGQERPRERRDDQRDRRRAHQQQEPVPDPPAPHRLVGNLLHEHQRRELDDVLALALNQVHEDRHDDRGEAEEEEGSQERHLKLGIYN